MRTTAIVGVAALLALGCASDGIEATRGALGGEEPDGGVCEPEVTTPIVDVATGLMEIGALTISYEGDEVAFYMQLHAAYELAGYEMRVGTSLPLPEYVEAFASTQSSAVLRIDLVRDGVVCGDLLKVAGLFAVVHGDQLVPAGALGGTEWMIMVDGKWERETWYDFYEVCAGCEEPDGCRYTQGYWKNHPEAWPVDHLILGRAYYSTDELLSILDTPPRGDGSLILARQLVAALLNVANGAANDPAIDDAQAWLLTYSDAGRLPYGVRRGPAKDVVTSIADRLAQYNESHSCD